MTSIVISKAIIALLGSVTEETANIGPHIYAVLLGAANTKLNFESQHSFFLQHGFRIKSYHPFIAMIGICLDPDG